MVTIDEQRKFYDNFITRLIRDYIYGNARTEAAITHAVKWIPETAKRILDIGCGIGWTTYEIKKAFPNSSVSGIDLSDNSIEIAKRLFGEYGIEFSAQDITQWSDEKGNQYDAIVMIDVYEHIPTQNRETFHQVLSKSLSPDGYIIMTFPSIFKSENTKEDDNEVFQPVDENVSLEDIICLANDVSGTIMVYSHTNIWDTNDYVHAVICRNPKLIPLRSMRLSRQRERGKRVASRLGIKIPGQEPKEE